MWEVPFNVWINLRTRPTERSHDHISLIVRNWVLGSPETNHKWEKKEKKGREGKKRPTDRQTEGQTE